MIEPLEEKLFVPENNDVDLSFTVRDKTTGNVLPLSPSDDVEFFVKPSRQTPDNSVDVTKLTRDAGNITFINSSLMDGSIAIPGTAIQSAGVVWYKLDVIRGSKRRTEKHGPLIIQDV